jgi:hypothetical protein
MFPADHVARPPLGQQQGADGQGIACDHPLGGGQVGVEASLYGGKGNNDAAVVHHRYEGADGQDAKYHHLEPALEFAVLNNDNLTLLP